MSELDHSQIAQAAKRLQQSEAQRQKRALNRAWPILARALDNIEIPGSTSGRKATHVAEEKPQ